MGVEDWFSAEKGGGGFGLVVGEGGEVFGFWGGRYYSESHFVLRGDVKVEF